MAHGSFGAVLWAGRPRRSAAHYPPPRRSMTRYPPGPLRDSTCFT